MTYKRYSTIYFCIGFDTLSEEVILSSFIQLTIEIIAELFPQLHEIDFLSRGDDMSFLFSCLISNGQIINTNKENIISKCKHQFSSSSSLLLYTFH